MTKRKRKIRQSTINFPSSKRRRRSSTPSTVSISSSSPGSLFDSGSVAALAGVARGSYVAADIGSIALPMLGGNVAAQLNAAVIGGAALATGAGYGLAAAGTAYLAARAINSLFAQTNTTTQSLMASQYSGRVGRQKPRQATMALRNQYQPHGAVVIQEIYGAVNDPDQVMIGHTAFSINAVTRALFYALIRKLFRRGGIPIETTSAEFRMLDLDNSGPNAYIIGYQTSDVDGSLTYATYAIPNDCTLDSMYADTVGMIVPAILFGMMTEKNPIKLEYLILFQKINNTDGARNVAQINIKDEKIDLGVNVHTVIQNVSRGTNGDTSNSSIVAQPLKGRVFEFSGIPKTKQANNVKMNVEDISGVFLQRAGGLVGSDVTPWKEPPTRASFSNVVKTGAVSLVPGMLKDMELSGHWSGYAHTLLCGKLRLTVENNLVATAPGHSQVVFLEEELNSGSTQLITVNYETQHTVGALWTTSSKPNMLPFYSVGTVNNLTP